MPFSYINQTQEKSWNEYRIIIKRIIRRAIELEEMKRGSHVNVILLKDNAMHEYNLTYKKKDYPTDVLTFVSDDPDTLADIFINVDACERQATEYNHSLEREFAFLFAHGLLHACGYDHQNEHDEAVMIQRQKELLSEYPRDFKATD